MLARGIDTETVLLLTHLRDKWMCGMLWGHKGLGNGASNIFPRRLSARKIIEDHFSGLGPRPMLQEEKDRDTHWKQDEARRLDDEVRRMEEAEKVECGVQGNTEGLNEKEEARDNEGTSEEPEPPCGEDLLDDTCSDSSEIDVDIPADAEARIGKLILLHSDKHRTATLIQELKSKGVDETDSKLQVLMDVAEKDERKLCKYWEKGVIFQPARE
ncbi:hypothetical protein BJ165DRAFT_1502605 [Panaeolus papilionaceus]|nr:hypothetical protein BJ165DRAFT_1502605 [Panaeolus papilionaceus]